MTYFRVFISRIATRLTSCHRTFITSTITLTIGLYLLSIGVSGCTQEQQNTLSRKILNWTGTHGVLDVFSNGKLMYRIIHIDKLSTATATSGHEARPYRYGYGVMDLNFNYIQDQTEQRTYFEISEFSTPYIFYENPIDFSDRSPSHPLTQP